MALVALGPELDIFLRGIGEDLKGKTILDEPYVDKKTIIRAVSEQNKVILALQTQILQMLDVERGMQRKIDMMQEKVTYLEKYTEKVDNIECILREKVPLVDKIDDTVKEHDAAIGRVFSKVKENHQALSTFKVETRGGLSENREGLKKLKKEVESMPEEIMISSRQVTHSIDDEKIAVNTAPDDGKELLVDIIAQQEQHAYVQDENLRRVENTVNENEAAQRERNEKIKNNLKDLLDWKRAQSSVDLVLMKKNQESIQATINENAEILSQKMSKEDVDHKLQHQFNEIVDHLQSALSSIENEEADFKSITDSLSQMCEALREKKADKAEIVALRKQFIENQVENDGPKASSTLDNDGLRRILLNYPTKDNVKKMLQENGKYEVVSDIVRIDSKLQQLHSIIKQLVSSMSNESFIQNESLFNALSRFTIEELITNEHDEESCPEKSHPVQKEKRMTNTQNYDIKRQGCSSVASDKSNSNLLESPMTRIGEDFIETKFPTSSMTRGVLSKIAPDTTNSDRWNPNDSKPQIESRVSRPSSAPRTTRPSSAPHREPLSQTNITKKHSLPAILTSISKTMRPRSKAKARVNRQSSVIHKGSYHVMSSSLELGKSSDHFISQLPSKQTKRPKSSEQRSRKKQIYTIRTSIE